ncbi:uncharacterized protein BCR38DRAFT_411338 [Pseudomassariella vexata]|uniref:Uncharacterized protein n=1 Tax=Pseudomassariella vexata TaxID=1141098 RepID=A0A1Y2DS00_9PEZI|nr:uncharacterized protein BCR38DRAFT_411338 [Pseudomassariella vexata]ORY61465.1 hypothetical protein BCR38DRAFT_411338 [Pseudomassariella vexata]
MSEFHQELDAEFAAIMLDKVQRKLRDRITRSSNSIRGWLQLIGEEVKIMKQDEAEIIDWYVRKPNTTALSAIELPGLLECLYGSQEYHAEEFGFTVALAVNAPGFTIPIQPQSVAAAPTPVSLRSQDPNDRPDIPGDTSSNNTQKRPHSPDGNNESCSKRHQHLSEAERRQCLVDAIHDRLSVKMQDIYGIALAYEYPPGTGLICVTKCDDCNAYFRINPVNQARALENHWLIRNIHRDINYRDRLPPLRNTDIMEKYSRRVEGATLEWMEESNVRLIQSVRSQQVQMAKDKQAAALSKSGVPSSKSKSNNRRKATSKKGKEVDRPPSHKPVRSSVRQRHIAANHADLDDGIAFPVDQNDIESSILPLRRRACSFGTASGTPSVDIRPGEASVSPISRSTTAKPPTDPNNLLDVGLSYDFEIDNMEDDLVFISERQNPLAQNNPFEDGFDDPQNHIKAEPEVDEDM